MMNTLVSEEAVGAFVFLGWLSVFCYVVGSVVLDLFQ